MIVPVRQVTQIVTSFAVIVALVAEPRSDFAAELSVDDFDFDGILGSDGATLEQLGPNHFKIHLAHAPGHPEWRNMCQFAIKQNAKGNTLRLDGVGGGIRQFCSWSYDRQPLQEGKHANRCPVDQERQRILWSNARRNGSALHD